MKYKEESKKWVITYEIIPRTEHKGKVETIISNGSPADFIRIHSTTENRVVIHFATPC